VVTVNDLPARQWSLPGGVQWAFDSPLPLAIGGNDTTANVTIRATDALNNVTTHTWTVPVGSVAANFTYDANGDRYKKNTEPGTSMNATTFCNWSTIGQLTRVEYLNPAGNETANVSLAYDGVGRRESLTPQAWNGTALVTGNEEYYIWDGDQIIQKRVGGSDSSNITEEFYTYGYQTANGGGNITGNYFYTKDHLGSIREVVASDGQTVEGRYNYGPWGETNYLDYSGGNVAQPDFGYAGYFRSQYVPGLYMTENRIYDPSTGTWLSRDPLPGAELSQGPNLYQYAHNNPIDNTDPSGLVYMYGHYGPPNNGPWNNADTAAALGLGLAPLAVYAAPEIASGAGSCSLRVALNPAFQKIAATAAIAGTIASHAPEFENVDNLDDYIAEAAEPVVSEDANQLIQNVGNAANAVEGIDNINEGFTDWLNHLGSVPSASSSSCSTGTTVNLELGSTSGTITSH
jgi:RHS repeat-associated protein